MARVSPLREEHARLGARFAPCGPPADAIPVVDAFDAFELEYAAIRKAAALFDEPHAAVIEARGSDWRDFLDRMLTQKLSDIEAGRSRASYWLNRQGRIVADVRVLALEHVGLLCVDAHVAHETIESLGAYLFAEDVELTDMTERLHRVSAHGPQALETLRAAGASAAALASLDEPGCVAELELAGARVVAERRDRTAEVGVHLIVDASSAPAVWAALQSAGAKPVGWRAINTARVEAGEPLFMVDFGQDSLPHETSVVRERVSMSKGCYLGQEIVARMESRGKSARKLAALKLERIVPAGASSPIQPMTGDAVLAGDASDVVGATTSSVVSPMLSDAPLCFAMMKSSAASPGARVVVEAQGERIAAVVQESLRFWPAQRLTHGF